MDLRDAIRPDSRRAGGRVSPTILLGLVAAFTLGLGTQAEACRGPFAETRVLFDDLPQALADAPLVLRIRVDGYDGVMDGQLPDWGSCGKVCHAKATVLGVERGPFEGASVLVTVPFWSDCDRLLPIGATGMIIGRVVQVGAGRAIFEARTELGADRKARTGDWD